MTEGFISAIQRFSIHDGPGIRTVIFFKGCPFNCPWCSNPETRSAGHDIMHTITTCIQCGLCSNHCPSHCIGVIDGGFHIDRLRCTDCGTCAEICPTNSISIRGERRSASDLLEIIKADAMFYRRSGGGVTFSGGEPLLQAEFLSELAAACKSAGIRTATETTGCCSPEDLKRVMPYIDLFLYDLKIMDLEKHREITGVSNELIKENLQLLSEAGKEIVVRVPVIPGYTQARENLIAIAETARKANVKQINLLPYHNYGENKYAQLGKKYEMENIKPLTKEDLAEEKELFETYGFQVKLGG